MNRKHNNEITTEKTDSKQYRNIQAMDAENPLTPIARDLSWLKKYCSLSIKLLVEKEKETPDNGIEDSIMFFMNNIPDTNTNLPYDHFLRTNKINFIERLTILTAIAPYFSPEILSPLASEDPNTKAAFPQAGGIINNMNKEFIPTLETVRFLITQNSIKQKFLADQILNSNSRLFTKNIIKILNPNSEIAWNKYIIQPSDEFLALIRGEHYQPTYSSSFPASKISTRLDWNDLILPYDTKQELKEVMIWLKHSKNILSHPHLGKFIKPGFRSLFYGPPGTGKTLTASLVGKNTGKDVYRIDLSMVVSKWIGETEKNLKNIFDQAENKDWILFFDEADSLFGKRTQTKSSNDRHANQEIAYLLQRIEDFPGVVVLATNMKDNIDEAFSRRFQSMVYFPVPDAENRLALWKNSLPPDYNLEESIDLYEIAQQHELSGGIINNVIRYCTLMAMEDNRKTIHEEDMEIGIARELKKSGKIIG